MPAPRSQTFRVLSSDAETAPRPVGRHCHGVDRGSVPFEGAEQRACAEVPDLQGLVVGRGDGPVPIGRHRHGSDRVSVPFEGAEQRACAEVPDLQGLVVGRGDGPRPVGRHRHGSDRVGVPFKALNQFTSGPCQTGCQGTQPGSASCRTPKESLNLRRIDAEQTPVKLTPQEGRVADQMVGTQPQRIPHQGEGTIPRERLIVCDELHSIGGHQLGFQPFAVEEQPTQLVASVRFDQMRGQVLEKVPIVRSARPAVATPAAVGLQDVLMQAGQIRLVETHIIVIEVVERDPTPV